MLLIATPSLGCKFTVAEQNRENSESRSNQMLLIATSSLSCKSTVAEENHENSESRCKP